MRAGSPWKGIFSRASLSQRCRCSFSGKSSISASSVVESIKELMEKIHDIHKEFDSPALIEEYIEGREIYAAILENQASEFAARMVGG